MSKIKNWIKEHETELEVAGFVLGGLVIGVGIGMLIGHDTTAEVLAKAASVNHSSEASRIPEALAKAAGDGYSRACELYENALGGKLISVSSIHHDPVTIESLGDDASNPGNAWLIDLLSADDRPSYEYRDIIIEIPEAE